MGIQTITTPAGEEMVVMPRTEYEALIAAAEDAFDDGADAATFAAAAAAMREEDILPPEVSAAILRGHGRVRALREWRGISREELAKMAELPELSEIEDGDRVLSREAAARISHALLVPASWLAA